MRTAKSPFNVYSNKVNKLYSEIAKFYDHTQFEILNEEGEHGDLKMLASEARKSF